VNYSTDRRLQLLYVAGVIGVGVAVLGEAIGRLWTAPPGVEWFLLAALTLLTGSFTVKLPSLSAKISVSETFVFTSALLFGPPGGTITVVLDALVISLWMKREKRSPTRVLFNATAPAIAIRVASEAFFRISHTTPGHINQHDVGQLIAPVFAFALLYFIINTALVAVALGFERKESPLAIWLTHFPPVSITYFVGSSIALLIVAYTEHIDIKVLSIIVPLLVISYLTFRTSMGRLEDAIRHVSQVNDLYLSTVETLAMAVDAKDQVTHGHIRRVQVYALELAKRLGLEDRHQLKAIEAAALLHDMGKLAIPEHILNKPGKLTTAEFSKMKRHADIGADLLSSIRFPYPVVPIVRHHHENWDGTGYPTGLAGTDIPLGARVLSVVDCFDALTSDRPYRPRLTSDEAFVILQQRRGTMYDPLVVDMFASVYAEIAPAARLAGEQARSLTTAIGASDDPSMPFRDIRANAAQAAAIAAFGRELERTHTLRDMVDVTFQYVRQLTPATVFAIYRHIQETDSLSCIAAAGDPERFLDGLTMRNGERISGWSAANEKTIANSQATLDLNAIADLFVPPLRAALATPLKSGDRIVGTMTAYATRDEPFTDDHRYAFERLASSFAEHFQITMAKGSNANAVLRFPMADAR
jgi:putative nucleotidyltransferase with HDIG domain